MNQIEDFILGFEVTLAIIAGIFGIVLYVRKKALQTVAQQNLQSQSKRFKYWRIILQLFNILVYTTLVAVQMTQLPIIGDDDESINKLYAGIWLLPILIGIWQIDIENSEFKSKIPLMVHHKIYWVLQMASSLAIVLYLLFKKNASESFIRFIIYLSRASIEFLLVTYFVVRRQDIQEFMELPHFIWNLNVNEIGVPLLTPSPMQMDNNSDQGTNESEINVIFYAGYILQNNILQFKMKVILNPRRSSSGTNFFNQIHYSSGNNSKEYILTKDYSEFLQLQEDLNEEIRKDIGVTDSALHDIDEINVLCCNKVELEFNQIQNLRNKLVEFMKILSSNPNFYYQCFLDFLKIEEMDLKQYFLKMKANNPKRLNHYQNRVESIHNQTQSFNQEKWNSEYFEIIFDKIEDINIEYVKYNIKIINLQNKAHLKLQIRYSELRQLHSNLKSQFEYLPPFPQKKFISTTNPAFINERMSQLNIYLCILLNEEEYHRNKILFNLLQPFASKYVNPRIWEINPQATYRCNYGQWLAESCGNFIQMTDGDSKGFTVYKFNIYENEIRRGQIEKRFKEFVKLHEFVEQKFSHVILNLPSLPPKISNFNTNIPKEKRQQDLQEYLNKLFKLNKIESCYYFRQFFSNVNSPIEALNLSSPPQQFHEQSLNNPDHRQEIQDDIFNNKFENSNNGQDRIEHLNSLQIDELQQYATQLSPTNNQP